jgi:hypothetical protein
MLSLEYFEKLHPIGSIWYESRYDRKNKIIYYVVTEITKELNMYVIICKDLQTSMYHHKVAHRFKNEHRRLK